MKHLNPIVQIVVTAGVMGLLSAGTAHAQRGGNTGGDKGPSYRIIRLDTDDGTGATLPGYAFDISTSRLIVGEVDSVPACWTVTELNGEFRSHFQFLDRASLSLGHAKACNEGDEIVGLVYDGGTFDPVAVYWSGPGAAMQELPFPLDRSAAFAINESSVICGWSSTFTQDEYKAILWSFTGGAWKSIELTPLGDPGQDENGNLLPDQAVAQAISDADVDTGVITVVGQSNGNAVAWSVIQDGSGALLAGPATILDPAGEPQALNNRMVACGFSGGLGGVVWVAGGAPQPLALDPSETWTASIPYDVNDGGLLVGHNDVHAVLWPDKDVPLIVLQDFLPRRKSPFYSLDKAPAVNESNEIVGAGRAVKNGVFLPFLAVPAETSAGGRP